MAENFGPGILGSVVLIDPATGLPYRAESGGGGSSDALTYVGDWDADTEYTVGQIVHTTTSGNRIGFLWFALQDNAGVFPSADPDTWRIIAGADEIFGPHFGRGASVRRNAFPIDFDDPESQRIGMFFEAFDPLSYGGSWGENSWLIGTFALDDSDGNWYMCIQSYTDQPWEWDEEDNLIFEPPSPKDNPEHWVQITGQSGGGGSANVVRSDTTDTYAYMGVAPSGTDPATGDWNITRITLTDPNNPKHAVGPWNDRATLTYA